MGSFHTNCRDVSLQLNRRFLDTREYSITNWPTECREEISPLLSSCRYSKGSLNHVALENTIGQQVIK